MIYENIVRGAFLERLNRFVAQVEINGRTETVHVKNTGRCRELLKPGAAVYLEDHGGSMGARKTRWDLIGVEKQEERMMLINMDSQAPNRVVGEALRDGTIRLPDFSRELAVIRPETVFGSSRFDFYVEGAEHCESRSCAKAFIEVKGVTLEEDGIARFPDAPTERGVKHIQELCEAKRQGYEAYIIFVLQMKPIQWLEPNDRTHKAFGDALREADRQGVHILAFDCEVGTDRLRVDAAVPVRL